MLRAERQEIEVAGRPIAIQRLHRPALRSGRGGAGLDRGRLRLERPARRRDGYRRPAGDGGSATSSGAGRYGRRLGPEALAGEHRGAVAVVPVEIVAQVEAAIVVDIRPCGSRGTPAPAGLAPPGGSSARRRSHRAGRRPSPGRAAAPGPARNASPPGRSRGSGCDCCGRRHRAAGCRAGRWHRGWEQELDPAQRIVGPRPLYQPVRRRRRSRRRVRQ